MSDHDGVEQVITMAWRAQAASRVAGLEVGLGGRPTRHGRGVAPPRLRVVLDPPLATAGGFAWD
jgi:hypothetical protein